MLSKLWYSSLIGQCTGHVTRFLKSYDFIIFNFLCDFINVIVSEVCIMILINFFEKLVWNELGPGTKIPSHMDRRFFVFSNSPIATRNQTFFCHFSSFNWSETDKTHLLETPNILIWNIGKWNQCPGGQVGPSLCGVLSFDFEIEIHFMDKA